MNNNRERKILYLGAFIHDIGKAVQRAGNEMEIDRYYGSHPNQGYQFILKKEKAFTKILSQKEFSYLLKYIQAHHESHIFKKEERADLIEDQKLKCLATIISRADNYSSSERGQDNETNFIWSKQKLKPVYSIFNNIELYKKNDQEGSFYSFERLTMDSIFCKKNISEKALGGMIDEFGINLDTLLENKNIDNLEHGLNYLINNYFWCIPANTKELNPDVSLYDHLKTTSAIATCIYDYHYEKNNLTEYSVINDNSLPRFRLIAADFSGIQKYIFDIANQEKAGKRIRARSFFVQMLLEDVKMTILKELDLPIFNVIFQSGGKFFILAPNLKNIEEKIKNIQKDIDYKSISQFNGEISLNLALSDEFCGKGGEGVLSFQDFEKVLENAINKLSIKQKKPFIYYLQDKDNNHVIDNTFDGKSLCPLCRKFPSISKEDNNCSWCKQDIKIGELLTGSNSLFLEFSDSGEFKLFNYCFNIRKDTDSLTNSEFVIVLNPEVKKIDKAILERKFSVNYLGNYTPFKDFEEIALESCQDKKNCGVKMLGVLKADVDNLGKIFSVGLKRSREKNHNTISRQSTLSRMLDLFFSGYLNNLVREYYDNCYILYSGGDDLVIIGPWDDIISLSQSLNQKFSEFVNNPEITLSAGVIFFKHNYPIYSTVMEAEKRLENAKSYGKDSINIFKKNLKWGEFNQIYPKEMNRVDYWLQQGKENNGISTQFVRSLLRYGEMIDGSFKNPKLMMWQPLFAYNIARNINKNSEVWDWSIKVSGMEKNISDGSLFKIIRDNLSLIAQYALYRNRK